MIRIPLAILLALVGLLGYYKFFTTPRLSGADLKSLEQGFHAAYKIKQWKRDNNFRLMRKARDLVIQNGYRYEDINILSTLESINAETNEVVRYMDALRVHMIRTTGGRNENGTLWGPGKPVDWELHHAKEVFNKLNHYTERMTALTGATYATLTRDPDGKPLDERTFETCYMDAPLVVVVYSFDRIEMEVLGMEQQALEKLSQTRLPLAIEPVRYVPYLVPEANIVKPGSEYRATVGVVAVNTLADVEMYGYMASGDQKKLPRADGTGMLYTPIKWPAAWKVSAKFPNHYQLDTLSCRGKYSTIQ